jgi:ribosome-binding protein aMBF1 (putative translation factor)
MNTQYGELLRQRKDKTVATKKWADIRHKVPAERRARLTADVEREVAEMPLRELRRARELSQARLAETLEMTQSEVSKIERRTDLYLSTLRSYIEAMGGELEIIARFPDGDAVRVTQFAQLESEERDSTHA